MKFLTPQDLRLTIEEENINEITNCNFNIVEQAEEIAIEEISDYLRKNYNTDFELRSYVEYGTAGIYGHEDRVLFVTESTSGELTDYEIKVWSTSGEAGTTGEFISDDRNISLKNICLNILKFHLFQRVSPRQISDSVISNYNISIDKLTRASQGKIELKLRPACEDRNTSSFRYGKSNISKKYDY